MNDNNYFLERIEFLEDYVVEPFGKSRNPKAVTEKRTEMISGRELSTALQEKRKRLGLEFHKPVKLIGKERYATREYTYIRLFGKGLSIDFMPGLNVIVGENGSGKSTLLKIIANSVNKKAVEGAVKMTSKNLSHANFNGWDFEDDNPKHSSKMKPNPDNPNFLSQVMFMFSTNAESHGETMMGCLDAFMPIDGHLIVFDEPESAMSLFNQYRYWNSLNEFAARNQLVMVTHSKLFIEESEIVYDMESKEWVGGKEYVESVRNKMLIV